MSNRFNSWSAIAAEQEKTMWRNLEKTKKPKNQNFLEKFWFQVKRCFFLVFLEFFGFFLVFKKENQKKTSFDLKPKLLQKVLVFWFSRGFVKILFCWKRRVLLKEEEFLRRYTTFWKYKIDAKKKQTFKHSKKQQNSANTSKFWESMGLGGGGYQIYIYIYIFCELLVLNITFRSLKWWC